MVLSRYRFCHYHTALQYMVVTIQVEESAGIVTMQVRPNKAEKMFLVLLPGQFLAK